MGGGPAREARFQELAASVETFSVTWKSESVAAGMPGRLPPKEG